MEIKNTRSRTYRATSFEIKLEMCSFLQLRPLFVSRMAPKSYSYEIIRSGGISWILGTQFYPFGHQELADTVRERLRLPIACRARIEDGAVVRLQKATKWTSRQG